MVAARMLLGLGFVLLLASFSLLLVTCLSTPNTSLPIFTLEAGRRSSNGTYTPNIRLEFGLWGFCQWTSTAWRTHRQGCFRTTTQGYDASYVVRQIVSDFPSSMSRNKLRDLTLGFVLPAVAAATAGLAIIATAAASVRPKRIASFAGMLFSALSFVFTVAAVGCVFAYFENVRKQTPDVASMWTAPYRSSTRTRNRYVLSTRYGACAFTLAAACVILLVATVVMSLAWKISERQNRPPRNEMSRVRAHSKA
ncbi:hypothetical protein CTA1_4262 [Colletotrichum tanaceti]|uniref:PH-response regulator protein palI/RIM9 n=1 Tax=Colletotrichum tanaceti TaxID=1306861 RepID=A0A4U6XJW8_9PEZI|nr:hypothetical protein CTA1_4262 [Colletotrichum tanaceti]